MNFIKIVQDTTAAYLEINNIKRNENPDLYPDHYYKNTENKLDSKSSYKQKEK